MPRYRIAYKYWLQIPKAYGTPTNYEVEAKSVAAALDIFYTLETESDGDISLLHIISIQKKNWFFWKEI